MTTGNHKDFIGQWTLPNTDLKGLRSLEAELAARFKEAREAAALEKEEAKKTEVWDALFEEEG